MTRKSDVVKEYFTKAWTNPPTSTIEAVETYFSDDFKSFDKDGNVVLDKQTFLGMTQLLLAAFKGFIVHYSDIHEEGDRVITKYNWEGIQTGDLDLTAMGLGVIPASGEKVVWPEAISKWKVEGNQIVSEVPITAGMEWFLAPLGVTLPTK